MPQTVWNFLDCDTYIALQNGNRTAWSPTKLCTTGARSTEFKGLNSGKWYFEFDDITLSGGDVIGLAPGAADGFQLGQVSGFNDGSLFALTINENGGTYGYPSLGSPNGRVVGVALDTTAPNEGSIKCWVSYDNTWLRGEPGNPDASFALAGKGMYLYARLAQQWSRATILTGNTRFPAPAGYATWDDRVPTERTQAFIIGA